MRVTEGTQVPDFTFVSPWEAEVSFHRAIAGRPSVLFFLRYLGCPLCQMKIAEIRRDLARFAALDARVFVALQSDQAVVRPHIERELPLTIICDPTHAIFRQYGVEPGGILAYVAPSVLLKGVRAMRRGFRKGQKEGIELQRPATFVIDAQRTARFAHYGTNIGDVPNNELLLNRLSALQAARA